jgi:pimeloyl-ACP methyl ester carboxylesterase
MVQKAELGTPMQHALIAAIRNLVSITLLALAVGIQPACAQRSGDTPNHVSGTPAGDYARYNAPYAIQAAAAYIDVNDLNATLSSKQPSSDVQLAVDAILDRADPMERPAIRDRAMKYFRSWRYQFGNQGYLTCLDSDADCLKAMKRDDSWTFAISTGPAFHVWARFRKKLSPACDEVSIAFRGTESRADFIANAPRSFRLDDHYRQLRRNIDVIIKKITALPCYRGAGRSQIVSVGHSLGGGLAQMAALANSKSAGRPRINKVFAFDSSPITGAGLLDKKLREDNASDLEIDRIYQSHEALAWVRPLAQQFPPNSSPCVRTVVYDVFQPTGIVGLHNMAGLARQIVQFSYLGDQQKPFRMPKPTTCLIRYRRPHTDQDDYDRWAPYREPGVISSLPRGFAAQVSRANLARTAATYARNYSFEVNPVRLPATDTSVGKPGRESRLNNAGRAGRPYNTASTTPWQQYYAAWRMN